MRELGIVFFLLFTVSLAYAVPGLPHQFYGTVTINGAAAHGAGIVAKVSGIQAASTTSDAGTYGYSPSLFFVTDENNNRTGKTIEFFVNGTKAADYTFKNGDWTELNLSIGSAPQCGDGSCNGTETCDSCQADCGSCPASCGNGSCETGEDCSNCPSDCGSCPAPPSGGGSSGGGGGGGGGGAGTIYLTVTGNCIGQQISVQAKNVLKNPLKNAEIIVKMDGNEVARELTNDDGNAFFTFEEAGEYEFSAKKASLESQTKPKVNVADCAGEGSSESVGTEPEAGTGTGASATGACANIDCDDQNPCTGEECENGVCIYTLLSDIPCGENSVCADGECVSTVEETKAAAATGLFGLGAMGDTSLLVLVAVIVVVAALFLWKKKKA